VKNPKHLIFGRRQPGIIGALAAISQGMFGNAIIPLYQPPEPGLPKKNDGTRLQKQRTKRSRERKQFNPQPPGSNLRLDLGPSDAGRWMRNRTPSPGPTRLSVHDWWRRQTFGTSKRIENMTGAEQQAAHEKMTALRAKQKEARLGKL